MAQNSKHDNEANTPTKESEADKELQRLFGAKEHQNLTLIER